MLLNDADRRDLLFLATERQAAAYNRRRAYFPSSRDVARAYVNSRKRPYVLVLPLLLLLGVFGWIRK